MFELPASDFIAVVMEVKRLSTLLGQQTSEHNDEAPTWVRTNLSGTIASMRDHLSTIGAQSAWVAADRLHKMLGDPELTMTYADLREHVRDIESRFSDHLAFIKLFVARPEQIHLFGGPVALLGEDTANRFTSIWFDCDEAAKCICVWRPTAAVFHCMRILELGIKAFALKLDIPDPVKPSERNWGVFLRTIKNKIDATYPAEARMPGSEGAFMESLFATLDAVKNPWRNETMHVEGVYTDAEARFILINTVAFIQKMATGFDEGGKDVNPPLKLR